MKPMPMSSIALRTTSGLTWICTPSASSTSAAPDRRETARFPCLATYPPAAATTNAVVVEMLNVLRRSPPVPTTSMSTSALGVMRCPRSRIARARPAISSTVSPFIRRAVMNAAIWAGVAWPSITCPIAACASASLRLSRSVIFRMAALSSMMMSGAMSASRRFEPRHLHPGQSQEVAKQGLSGRCQHRFRMELHALHQRGLVAQAHDRPVGEFCRDFQHVGQRLALHDERMIPGANERIRNSFVDRAPVMEDLRHLPVHGRARAHYPPAERRADALVPQADAEDRHPAGELSDQRGGDPRLRGGARPRRDNNGLRLSRGDVVHRDFVIAEDAHVAGHL